jgi:cellulose synthase/poly-beta-1,6-N-acetylglucosamine synthase-like glycosyltransferase
MHVSIIIPSLNSPTIAATLAALRAQACPPGVTWAIFGVGRDESGQVQPFEGLTWLDTGVARPPAAARNLGAAAADGDILCFMDADCVAAPDWLARLTGAFAEPAVAVVGGGVRFDTDNYWTLADNIATFYPYLASAPAGTRAQLPSLNLALRRSVWEHVGPFDERYPFPAGEDSDWCTRARQAHYTLHFRPEIVVWHRPQRASAAALWQHAVRFGASSIKVDPRHAAALGRPWPLRHWALVLLMAPLLAGAVTARAFLGNRALWAHWPTVPAVYLAKLGWCWGAAGTLRRGAPWLPEP